MYDWNLYNTYFNNNIIIHTHNYIFPKKKQYKINIIKYNIIAKFKKINKSISIPLIKINNIYIYIKKNIKKI
jgi:hypothetical protein